MISLGKTNTIPGTLDQSFANEGVYRLQSPSPARFFGVRTRQGFVPERLYFTGSVRTAHSSYVLGCLLPDGTLDSKFAKEGLAIADFLPNANSAGQSVSLLDDGTILLHGWTRNSVPVLIRYDNNGAVDTTFGTAGMVVLEKPTSHSGKPTLITTEGGQSSANVMVLANGKILVAVTYVAPFTDKATYIFLLNSNGSPDKEFNGTGLVPVVHPGGKPADLYLRSGLVDPQGNIVVCGSLEPEVDKPQALFARYKPDGRPDTDFGEDGFVICSESSLGFTSLERVIVQPDNRLLGIGSTKNHGGLLISLELNGNANPEFNDGQPLTTRLGSQDTHWTAAAMQTDGKIIVVGGTYAQAQSASVVVRLLKDGQLDTGFNARGWWSTEAPGWNFQDVTMQSDGKIVIAGNNNQDGVVLRFNGGDLPEVLRNHPGIH